MRPALSEQTIRRVEQAAGRIATQSVARMDEQLPWFRQLPANQRSWVSLVAQAGVASFVEWLRSPDDVLRLTGDVFAAAPRAMARSVSLLQTVELVRQTIAVAEEQIPALAGQPEVPAIREELLRFSREIAFAAARVYAGAAESRGAWDARLEALLIDGLVRGAITGSESLSQIAALGWRSTGPVTAVVGLAPERTSEEVLAEVHLSARRAHLDALAGVHGGRLVVILGNIDDPLNAARLVLPTFGPGPIVASARAEDISAASRLMRAALSGLRVVPAWPHAPRPVSADALRPERALAGDTEARDELVDVVYRPLAKAGDVLLDTVATFLDSGGALETTARTLFVHVNTVRYRLRRAGEICGEAPTDPRGSYVIRVALTFGRLEAAIS
jgi:hypothetical protein